MNVLTFTFEPNWFYIYGNSYMMGSYSCQWGFNLKLNSVLQFLTTGSYGFQLLSMSRSNNSLFWYSETNSEIQFNNSDEEYYYYVFG